MIDDEQLLKIKNLENTRLDFTANEILTCLLKRLKIILETLNLKEIYPVTIYIYDQKEEFTKLHKSPYNEAPLMGLFGYNSIYIYAETSISKEKVFYCAAHELTHLIYRDYVQDKGMINRIIWFDEGLAQNLSGERDYLLNQEVLRTFLETKIFREDKIIPAIEYLSRHGSNFGEMVDTKTKKYNGYDWSYLIINYLLETLENEELQKLMRNRSMIKSLEQDIIERTANHFKKKIKYL